MQPPHEVARPTAAFGRFERKKWRCTELPPGQRHYWHQSVTRHWWLWWCQYSQNLCLSRSKASTEQHGARALRIGCGAKPTPERQYPAMPFFAKLYAARRPRLVRRQTFSRGDRATSTVSRYLRRGAATITRIGMSHGYKVLCKMVTPGWRASNWKTDARPRLPECGESAIRSD